MKLFLSLCFVSSFSFAGIQFKQDAYQYDFNDKPKKAATKRKTIKKNNTDNLLNELAQNDLKIEKLLEQRQKRLLVRKQDDSLNALTRIKGTLIKSAIATNNRLAILLIKLDENEFFNDAQVRCLVSVLNKRVAGKCDLVVTQDKEYPMHGQIWDLDGAEGLYPDEYYDGAEKDFLTSSFSSFFEGALKASKDTYVTPYGQFSQNSNKNSALSGLEAIAHNANQKVKDSSEKNIQVGLVHSGRKAIVYFDKRIKL